MKLALSLVLVALAAPAAAAPCEVELVRVPATARPIIEEWVAAEPSCATKLSVRVIETEGGLYIVATDAAGGIRERLVPDATTAAVLIASWAADASPPAPEPVSEPEPVPVPAPAAPPVDDRPTNITSTLVTPTSRHGTRPHTLALGVIMNIHAGAGVRVEMDLGRLGDWDSIQGRVAGLMFGVSATGFWVDGTATGGVHVEGTDGRILAMMTVHARPRRSRTDYRLSLGVGASVSRVIARDVMDSAPGTALGALTPCAEATVTSTVWIKGWGLRGGALLSFQRTLSTGSGVWQRGAEWRGSVALVRGW